MEKIVIADPDPGAPIRTTLKEAQEGLDPGQFWLIRRGTQVRVGAIAREG